MILAFVMGSALRKEWNSFSMHRSHYCLFLTLVLFGIMPLLGSSVPRVYGRNWWASTARDERIQFIAGYLDCAAYDRGKTEMAKWQWDVMEPKITKYYASHPESPDQTVPSLILALGATDGSTDQAPEVYPEKHGIFDGDYWRQITSPGRAGFVEGYIACSDSAMEGRKLDSHPTAWYVNQINRTYRLTGENDIDDGRRASKKIATIIQELTR